MIGIAYNVGIYANIRCVNPNNNFFQPLLCEHFVKKNAMI
jgi:hypothetical protein